MFALLTLGPSEEGAVARRVPGNALARFWGSGVKRLRERFLLVVFS